MLARDFLVFTTMVMALGVTAAPLAVPAAEAAIVEPIARSPAGVEDLNLVKKNTGGNGMHGGRLAKKNTGGNGMHGGRLAKKNTGGNGMHGGRKLAKKNTGGNGMHGG